MAAVALVVLAIVAVPLGPTFSATVGGDPLVASEMGEPGEREVSLTFTVDDTNIGFSIYCDMSSRAPYEDSQRLYRYSVDGHGYGATLCGGVEDPGEVTDMASDDPQQNRRVWAKSGVKPGEPATVRVWVPRDRPLADDPTVRLGVGVYEQSGPRVRENGVTLHELIDLDGRTYRLRSSVVQRVGEGRRLELPLDTDTDTATIAITYGCDGTLARGFPLVSLRIGGKDRESVEGCGLSTGRYARKGAITATVVADERFPDSTRLVLAVYVPVE